MAPSPLCIDLFCYSLRMASKEEKARWAREMRARKKAGLPQPKRGDNLRKHGHTKSPEHRSWLSMMTRCVWSGPERPDYHLYQGKGITVCERWKDFRTFLADMGPKPTDRHTIERLDSSLGYTPENCVWATPRQQANNTTQTHRLTCNGITHTLSEWSELAGITNSSMTERLQRLGVTPAALMTPKIAKRTKDIRGVFVKAISD